MNKISALIAVGSFAVGVVTGIVGTKKHFEKKYDDLYNENKKLLADQYSINQGYDLDVEINPEEEKHIPENLPENLTSEERQARKESIRRGASTDKVLYNKMFKKAEERSGENDAPEWTDEAMMEWHKEHIDDPPEIIDIDDIPKLPPSIDVSNMTLYFYDDVLISEDDESEGPIIDWEPIVGGCLDDFCDNKEERVVVLNPGLDAAYIVNKKMASYYNPDPDDVD